LNNNMVSISTPRFGGCSNITTGDISFCAIRPNECNSLDLTYVKPNKITGNICHHPSQVKGGRCSSSIDGNICAVDPSTCQIKSKFIKDDTCSIIKDDKELIYDALTSFPYCRKNEEVSCVMSSNECSGTFLSVGDLPWMDPCLCHNVPTGMCYLKSAVETTASTSFCAMGDYDCPENYFWESATKLGNRKNPPRTCRLCLENDDNSFSVKHVVEAGACMLPSQRVDFFCALESKECTGDNVFKSSRELRLEGHVPCFADDIKGGYCTSTLDDVGCTNIPEGCRYEAKFEPKDTCTMNNPSSTVPTYFGRCRESTVKGGNFKLYRCSWQSSECDSNFELWNEARLPENYSDGCECEHVHTGACKHTDSEGNEEYYCAVSVLGCSADDIYIKALDLKNQTNPLECRLCHPRNQRTDSPTAFPTTTAAGEKLKGTTSIPISSPTSISPPTPRSRPIIETKSDEPQMEKVADKGDSPGKSNTAAIVLGTFAGLFVVSVCVFIIRKTWITPNKKENVISDEFDLRQEDMDVNGEII